MGSSKPRLFILSAPSGTGKTSVYKKALEKLDHLKLSVSYTTREARTKEHDGIDYFFIQEKEFKQRIDDDDFLEWAEVFQNYYGTSISHIKDLMNKGYNVLLDIDVQGVAQLGQKDLSQFSPVYLFLLPPSLEELERRLRQRGTETEEQLQIRLSKASVEMSYKEHYDHILVNDVLEETIEKFIDTIEQEIILD